MTSIIKGRIAAAYDIRARGEPALMAYRWWRNISRDNLASKSGVPRDAIEAIEDGKADIEETMLESLSNVLKVPQDELI